MKGLARPAPGVLFISYHFPPSAAVGGQRTANFARGAATQGWRANVLTIATRDIEHVDPDRLRGIETVAVHRAKVWPTAVSGVVALLRRLKSGRRMGRVGLAPDTPSAAMTGRRTERGARVRRFLLSLLLLPDGERGWIVPASLAAVRLVRTRRIDWIVTSCPPYSVHLVGLIVRAVTRCRWVADFRDPWMTTGSKRMYCTSQLSLRIERWLERRVVAAADLVTFNTERLRNAYSERYAELRVEKFVFIPNGIPIQATNAASTERESRFTISYTGSLYVGRSPEPVFAALAQLLERGTITTSDVRVRLIGQCDAINGYPTQDLIRRYGLDSVVEVSGPISYQNAIDVIRRSHLALLLAPDLPYQVPAKVYDYLGAGTRILAIAQDGATADLLRETDAGRAFRPQDVGGIAAFIQSQFESRDTIAVDTARYLCRFDPDMLTRDLLSHLAVNVPVEEAGAAS